MAKRYQDRSMAGVDVAKDGEDTTVFFFPKENPPVSIRAKTREEAVALLKKQQS